jgi:hypothetical protein
MAPSLMKNSQRNLGLTLALVPEPRLNPLDDLLVGLGESRRIHREALDQPLSGPKVSPRRR